MLRLWLAISLTVSLIVFVPKAGLLANGVQPDTQIAAILNSNQYDIQNEGRKFLIREAVKNDFFLLGELHGDNEIPVLLSVLWPEMWKQGYRHIAAELSPWAAHQLEFVPAGQGRPGIQTLWTKQEAEAVHALADSKTSVLWGCDMEEEQPQFLIRTLSSLNPADSNLTAMVEMTRHGYKRENAPDLLALAERSNTTVDEGINDVSLRENLLATLKIDANRSSAETKMIAQNDRELLMKDQFLKHYRRDSATAKTKVLFRFGRNHLHRGYDARGISTLGNFIAEFAISESKKAFNVGAFGAGGTASLVGGTWNADERNDEPAFMLLAEKARYSATLYDLRPLRALLHRIPAEKRSPMQANLMYWADSYDALICYKNVTPLALQRPPSHASSENK